MDGWGNVSSDVMFVANAFLCVFSAQNTSTGSVTRRFWNARSLKPVGHDDNTPMLFGKISPVQCLSDRKCFKEPEVLHVESRIWDWRCTASLPSLTEIRLGIYARTNSAGCSWRVSQFHCQAVHEGGCTFTAEQGEDQLFLIVRYNSQESLKNSGVFFSKDESWRKRDAEMLKLTAIYIDFGLPDGPRSFDSIYYVIMVRKGGGGGQSGSVSQRWHEWQNERSAIFKANPCFSSCTLIFLSVRLVECKRIAENGAGTKFWKQTLVIVMGTKSGVMNRNK